MNFIYIIFAIIIFSLSIYLGMLFVRLKNQKLVVQDINDNQILERSKSIYESMQIISKVVIQGQCDLTEGCIRLYHLVQIEQEFREDPKLKILSSVYSRVKHLATFEDYKRLALKDRVRQDSERSDIEKEYSDEIIQTCLYLIEKLKKLDSSIPN